MTVDNSDRPEPRARRLDRRRVLGMMAAAPVAVPLLRAAAATAAPSARPNILVLMTDQERADVVLPPGFELPARARLAANGVRFAMHHTPTAPCSPARSTLFTGLQAPVSGMLDNVRGNDLMGTVLGAIQTWSPDLDTAIPTLGTVLRDGGYRTAYIGKWHLSDSVAAEPTGLSAYGFDEAIDILSAGGPNEGTQQDPGVVEHAVDWLRRHGADPEPWLCVVSMVNPHDMMFCPRLYRFEDVPEHGADVPPNFESDLSTKPRVQSRWRTINGIVGGPMPTELDSDDARQQWRRWGNWYLELLRRTDELTGRVLAALDRGGAADNTVVVRVADHGELGGAHGLRQKGAMIYRENNRVPLVIADPRDPSVHGRTANALTSHIDLVPTLAALAGIDGAAAGSGPGRNLVPVLADPARTVRDAILLTSDAKSSGGQLPGSRYCLRGAITARYSFARYGTAEQLDRPRGEFEYELYDRQEDPLELRNLAHGGGASGLVDDLNDLVDTLIARELRHRDTETR
ncbi:sulfatase-like hydrolase/transferase [Nocardia brasiliensis]|uniref:Sulfatase-like hydrolase/transferase n=1 Tax=Nocardia brasiliensis TaxID=37326 RepID=A0A6G9XQI6_NOCBR|nr:sulfatase-like hydrolase/transferase [Nocardia brasiliensis]QIS03212.1 sulfatase-like hydrolase/transferase [Nocardia brasiliensis]